MFCKLVDSTTISVPKDYAFLAIAAAFEIVMLITGYVAVLPALLVAGVMPGALVLVLVLPLFIKQLDNFFGALNFVSFPMFFLSSALYPLWKMAESSELLFTICALNPFTYVVDLIRFALCLSLKTLP